MYKSVVILTAMDPYKDIRAVKTAKALLEDGYSVSVMGGWADPDYVIDTEYFVISYEIPYNIKYGVLKKIKWKLDFFRNTIKKIKGLNPDIIHACNVDMLLLAFLCKRKNTKIVYDSYEICAHKSGVASNLFISKIVECFEHFLIKKSDFMICVSNSAEKYFRKKYNPQNIATITNVPDITYDIENHKLGEPAVLLYLGNFTPYRGIEELILSGKYIDNQQIKIHIQGFGAFENDFRKIISDNHLEENVEFIPPVLPSDVLKEISEKADVGVVLTRPTSLNHKLTVSNKVFDYINAGLPVIMSNVDEHIYLNKKYNIGIIITDITPEKIFEAVNKLVSDKEFYNKLSDNCLKAAKELNWNIEKTKLKAIYKTL